jgi:hypothetical protein
MIKFMGLVKSKTSTVPNAPTNDDDSIIATD